MRTRLGLALAIVLACATSAPRAEPQFKPHPTERVTAEQWQQYRDEVEAVAGASRREEPEQRLVTYATNENLYIAFTAPGHPAHPAWITRRFVTEDGKLNLAQIGYFAGSEPAFAELFRQYQELNKQMIAAMTAEQPPVSDAATGLAVKPPAGFAARAVDQPAGQAGILVSTTSGTPVQCYGISRR